MNNWQQLKPYNELWLDCISNNLISMLTCIDDSFKGIIFHAGVTYHKKILVQEFNYIGEQKKFLDEGFFTPKVIYSIDHIDQLFDKKSFTFNAYHSAEMDDFLKTVLHEGHCLFLSVDRFFYPQGRESGKYHMIHPVFIYGYNDEQECYHTIEDCMIPGTMDYYALPFSTVHSSCENFIESGKEIEVTICRLRNHSSKLEVFDAPVTEVIKMCKGLLAEGGQASDYNLLYHTGLDGILHYANEFVELFLNMQEYSLFKMRILQFQQVHKRNINLIKFLNGQGFISAQSSEGLCSQYENIHNKWEFFKRKSFEQIAKGKINGGLNSYKESLKKLSNQLKEIVKYEADAANCLISLCEQN